ncbi:MAG: sigma 54-interacting transcriptional regulator [Deltaproteobacteria bacterium]|nr:sigma 54-interacting transcriptional regulator [Deltaproteobacteria bacterium]
MVRGVSEVVLPRTVVRPAPFETTHHRPGRLSLRVTHPQRPDRHETITKDRIGCGRSSVNDVVIDDPSISASHFWLELGAHGVRLFDPGSTNGTWVSGARICEAWLQSGAWFHAGEHRFEIVGSGSIEVPLATESRFHQMVGCSPAMRETFARLRRLAPTDLDVLIQGETGTGKEMAARALHAASSRAKRPFVVLDCAWLSRDLAEDAIFGHAKGAYTQAHDDAPGAFETADGGFLFIDEIGELPPELQPRLLRVLDRREVQRLGERRPRPIDVRVISATHRDLQTMVAEGYFREDLYYRLVEECVPLPPLRARGDDIELLAEHVLTDLAQQHQQPLRMAPQTRARLRNHTWPGNVRELVKVLRRASRLAAGPVLQPADIRMVRDAPMASTHDPLDLPLPAAIERLERSYLERTLQNTAGNLSAAARAAGVSRKGLRQRLQRLGMYRGPAER